MNEWNKLTKHVVDANTAESFQWRLHKLINEHGRWSYKLLSGAATHRATDLIKSPHILVYSVEKNNLLEGGKQEDEIGWREKTEESKEGRKKEVIKSEEKVR